MDTVTNSDSLSFAKFALPQALEKALAKMNFTTPTPVQDKVIPFLLEGKDLISIAETGSGKTAAYLVPILAKILSEEQAPSNGFKQTLILAPTRELAVQIGDVVRDLTQFARHIKYSVVIGGAPMFKQARMLRSRPHLIVATPGRLADHLRQNYMDLKSVSYLILDEADRMFDMGFAPQVNAMIRLIPQNRQTLLFSATFADDVRDLAKRVLRNPMEIKIQKDFTPPKVINQKIIPAKSSEKNDRTLDIINAAAGSVIVFTRTKHRTDRLAKYLEEYGVQVTRIHGDRSQAQRNKSIQGIKSGLYRVMVATDIAARGLDVTGITDVVNYDIPMTVDDYIHRIGRTGRAGQEGQALTLVAPEEARDWIYIARKMGLPITDAPKGNGAPASQAHRFRRSGKPKNNNNENRRSSFGGGFGAKARPKKKDNFRRF